MNKYSIIIKKILDFVIEAENKEEALKEAEKLFNECDCELEVDIIKINS